MPDLVRNVTSETYAETGSDFIALNGGNAFVIALSDGKKGEVEYRETLPEWGAWLAFFRRAKIPHAAMLMREYYTVPARWPHEFTSDATVLQDHEAGAAFQRRWLAVLNNAPRDRQGEPITPRNLADARRRPPREASGYRPFPKLWEAFRGDVEATDRLDAGLSFDALNAASLKLASEGLRDSREYLLAQSPIRFSRSTEALIAAAAWGAKFRPLRREPTPEDDLKPPPKREPWHDKETLAASAARLLGKEFDGL